jgi:hypothetical protein
MDDLENHITFKMTLQRLIALLIKIHRHEGRLDYDERVIVFFFFFFFLFFIKERRKVAFEKGKRLR